MADFDSIGNYGVDPWGSITLNERTWYDPVLRDIYMRQSVYSQHVTFQVDQNGPKARTIVFNDLIPPRPNIAPLSNRGTLATRLYQDSMQRQVTTERGGNGMSLHRESDMFNYWERNGQKAGLMMIMQQALGQVIVDHLDTLARNAFFKHPYPFMGLGSASSFGGLSTSTDKMTTAFVDTMWLTLQDNEKPYSAIPQAYQHGEETLCLTTPGAVYDLKTEVGTGTGGLNFVDVNKYTEAGFTRLNRSELGMYRGIRFMDSPFAKLWNVGTTAHQTTITTAVKPGDGAPDPTTTAVEGARYVGQPGAAHSIVVASTTGFKAGDKISIHLLRHDSGTMTTYGNRGVLNGPIYDDPMKQDVEIHAVVDSTHLSLKEPYMMSDINAKGLETDLGSGVYGYVTIGQTVHTALFITPGLSSNALVCGVAQPPVIYTPPAIDDYMSIFRITYDFWMKYQLWDARAYNVAFLTGQNSLIGNRSFR